jgi:hypothetical protein
MKDAHSVAASAGDTDVSTFEISFCYSNIAFKVLNIILPCPKSVSIVYCYHAQC